MKIKQLGEKDITNKNMENRELIYEMAKRLNMVIEVWREGKYIGKYKFIDNKIHKLKEDEKVLQVQKR
jgi:hypothetical protein